jgi:SAM-dependent methyltransferase
MEWVSCALCNFDVPIDLTKVPDTKSGTRDAYCLVRCAHCGLVYVNPRPAFVEIQGYYDATYSPHSSVYANVIERERSDNQYYSGRVRQFWDCLPEAFGSGRLLDVGCGDGRWLYLVRKRGWETTGVEISSQAAQFAREQYDLDVKVGSLIEQQFPTGNFKVVTFWHSLEHLHDPRAALQEAFRILRQGGIVTVQVPNIDTILFRVFGRYYSMIQAPYHLYHFSPSTLGTLLMESGFEVYQTVYSPGINGIALSLKNWWLSIQGVSQRKIAKCNRSSLAPGDSGSSAVTWLKRKVVLPMLRPVGKFLAIVGHGDVFSMYARKR